MPTLKTPTLGEEDFIRNNLANDLSVLAQGLSFIQKEYPLPNYSGSKGYIDILATDIYNNYVIIEIKRSKATSRETFQEVLKYTGLLKQNFKIRDSEIKVILLSTHWDELFIPYCEFVYQSTLCVEGYKITLDEHKNILPI